MAHIDFINLDQTPRESSARWFIPNKLSFLVQDNPQSIRKHNYIESELRVYVISSKKMGVEIDYVH